MCRMIFHNFDLFVLQRDNSTQYKPVNCAIFPLFMPLSHCHSMLCCVEYGDLTEQYALGDAFKKIEWLKWEWRPSDHRKGNKSMLRTPEASPVPVKYIAANRIQAIVLTVRLTPALVTITILWPPQHTHTALQPLWAMSCGHINHCTATLIKITYSVNSSMAPSG